MLFTHVIVDRGTARVYVARNPQRDENGCMRFFGLVVGTERGRAAGHWSDDMLHALASTDLTVEPLR